MIGGKTIELLAEVDAFAAVLVASHHGKSGLVHSLHSAIYRVIGNWAPNCIQVRCEDLVSER